METLLKEKIIIPAETRHLKMVHDFMRKMSEASQLSPSDTNKVILATDEAVTNIIEHAYEYQQTDPIDIEVKVNSQRFKVTITDSGNAFDSHSIREPDILEHLKKSRKKGLGILLMRQAMDEVYYFFREGKSNEISMIKHIKK